MLRFGWPFSTKRLLFDSWPGQELAAHQSNRLAYMAKFQADSKTIFKEIIHRALNAETIATGVQRPPKHYQHLSNNRQHKIHLNVPPMLMENPSFRLEPNVTIPAVPCMVHKRCRMSPMSNGNR